MRFLIRVLVILFIIFTLCIVPARAQTPSGTETPPVSEEIPASIEQPSSPLAPLLPVAVGLGILALNKIIPSIIEFVQKNIQARTKVAEARNENAVKKVVEADEAQDFLADIGKTYYNKMREESEEQRSTISEYQMVIAEQRDQYHKAVIEKEASKIQLAASSTENLELRNKVTELKELDVKNKETINDLRSRLSNGEQPNGKDHQADLDAKNNEIKLLEEQLEEATRRSEAAISRYDNERNTVSQLNQTIDRLNAKLTAYEKLQPPPSATDTADP